MTIPIYDPLTMPCMVLPMRNVNEAPTKYLGGNAITGEVTVECEIVCKDDSEIQSLYSFWKNGINFGLEPFLVAMPLFGAVSQPTHPDYLVKFMGDFDVSKESNIWSMKIKMKLFGVINYIVDDLGNFVVSDTGDYVVNADGDYVATASLVQNSYREVVYAY